MRYLFVLTWRDAAKVYEFQSAHCKPVAEVMRLQRFSDRAKNNGPL